MHRLTRCYIYFPDDIKLSDFHCIYSYWLFEKLFYLYIHLCCKDVPYNYNSFKTINLRIPNTCMVGIITILNSVKIMHIVHSKDKTMIIINWLMTFKIKSDIKIIAKRDQWLWLYMYFLKFICLLSVFF